MSIVQKAEIYVSQLFTNKLSSEYTFHNLFHTKRVVASAKLLAEKENISDKDTENLLVAAWFHDVGYVDSCTNHESIGMKACENFLQQENLPEDDIAVIKSLIYATSMQYFPKNLLEKIIKDADLSHIGSDEFLEVTEYLRKECRVVLEQRFNKLEWAKFNLLFLESKHEFFTDYAKANWNEKKKENIAKTKAVIKKLEGNKADKESKDNDKSQLNKKKLEKMNSPERGIETMFRTTLNNHTRFSQIADTKANILLSVNAIIISVALSTIIPKLDAPKNEHLIIPTFILIIFSVATVVMAIISTRPKISSGTFTRKEIEERKINLLFFGNFHQMPLEEYMWAMKDLMKNKDYLYESMVKDLYYLGIVLNRKYKLLRTTYTIFMIGILVSVLAFYFAFKGIL